MPTLSVAELESACRDVFRAHGFTDEEIEVCVEEIVEAQCRGRSSHGIARLPRVLEWKSDAGGAPEVTHHTSISVHIVGNEALGPVVARRAMDMAVERARTSSIGLVGVRNKQTFLTAGYNARRAADQGCVGIVLSVAASNVAPWGGREALLGNNPLAIGIPADGGPLVLDLSIGEMIPPAVQRAAKRGEFLPEGVALDPQGNPTTDPARAIEGAILPFGGYKGSGLGVAIELLSGPLLGGKAGTTVKGGRGMLFIAIDPDVFGLGDEFPRKAQTFAEEIRASAPRPGFDEVMLPGDRGDRLLAEAREHGVELDEEAYAQLRALAGSTS